MTSMTSSSQQTRMTVFVATLSLVMLTGLGAGQAQTTDITSSGLNTQISAPTPLPNGMINFDITGGTRPGNGPNLFHSFGEFSVGADNIANFLNETALPTSNILSRVTGGNPSNIFGTLQTTDFGAANLYLINPAGVIFGPTAELNVGGSVNISTADYLKMTDGATFYANPAQATVLSLAPVAAFGFLGTNSGGKITVDGGTTLTVQSGQNFSLIGGDISVTSRTLSAPGGQISLVSVASAGEVVPGAIGQPASLSLNGFTALGNISLTQGTTIDTSSNAAGSIILRGGQLVMDGSKIVASTTDGPGGNIDVKVENMVVSQFAGILTGTDGAGSAGDITITAHTLALVNEGEITASTVSTALAGDITLNVDTLTAGNNSTISSSSSLEHSEAGNAGSITIQGITGSGSPAALVSLDNSTISTTIDGGTSSTTPAAINITAQAVNLTNNAQIKADTSGAAPAGNITLNVDSLTADSFPEISSSSSFTASLDPAEAGNAGNITIQGLTGSGSPATKVSLDGGEISTSIFGGSAVTTPGTITITAQTLALANFVHILTDTAGAAPAGNITLNVDSLTADSFPEISSSNFFTASLDPAEAGNAGNITIQGLTGSGSPAANVSLDNSIITTQISGGSAVTTPGTITITARTLALANGTAIGADTLGAGPAGNIALNVDALTAGSSRITSRSLFFNDYLTAGNAGSITIQGITNLSGPATSVSLDNSTITTGTFGAGQAGNITLDVGRLTASNGAQIDSSTTSTGHGGDLRVNANNMTLRSGAELRSASFGSGNAGSILIDGTTVGVTNGAAINSSTFGAGNAGTVTIKATEAVTVEGRNPETNIASGVTSAVIDGTGAAGSVTIEAPTITIADEGTVSTSNGIFGGRAGDILLDGERVTITGGAEVMSFTATEAPGGTVTIQATESVSISGPKMVAGGRVNTQVATDSFGTGNAGDVSITAPHFTMDGGFITAAQTFLGHAGDINITAQLASLTNGAFVGTNSHADGQPGSVTLQAARVDITNGASVSSSSNGGTGQGGSVTITATEQILLAGRDQEGPSEISTMTAGTRNAGQILVMTPVLVLQGGAIVANTQDSGHAGSITVEAGQLSLANGALIASRGVVQIATGDSGSVDLRVTGLFSSEASTISSEALVGAGGNVLITGGNMQLTDGTTISAKSAGAEEAGSIALTSETDLLMRNSTVTTSATQASGGNIKLTAPNLIRLVDSTITSSVQGQAGSNGGNINFDPLLVVIQNSQILANATAGAGGNITIAATGAVLVDPNSRIDASAGPAGISGSVNINAPIQILSGALVPLNLVYSQAGLSGDRCAADPQGQFSSFVQTGRDGVPQVPGALSPSPLSFLENLTSSSLGSPWPNVAAARLGLDSVSVDNAALFRFHSACRS